MQCGDASSALPGRIFAHTNHSYPRGGLRGGRQGRGALGRAALTGQGGGAGRQRRGEEVLVGLGLLQLWRPSLRVVGHLDLQGCGWAPGLVRAAGVPLLLGLQRWPDPLPPPLDQCHAVTDGLGHNLHIALMEKP